MRNLNREATTVERRWMAMARWAWIPVAVLAVGILIASIPTYLQLYESDFPPGLFQNQAGTLALAGIAFGRLVSFGTAVLSISLAGILYRQRADDWMALLVSYFLLIYGVTLAGPSERLLQPGSAKSQKENNHGNRRAG